MSRAAIAPDGAVMIAKSVAALNSISPADFFGPRRYKHLVAVRRLAAVQCHGAGYSLPEIGAALKRDHTTVLWLLRGGRRKAEP